MLLAHDMLSLTCHFLHEREIEIETDKERAPQSEDANNNRNNDLHTVYVWQNKRQFDCWISLPKVKRGVSKETHKCWDKAKRIYMEQIERNNSNTDDVNINNNTKTNNNNNIDNSPLQKD